LHDEAYKSWPCEPTTPIDKKFLKDCTNKVTALWFADEITIDEFTKYLVQAKICYRLTRIWGTGRYQIAKTLGWDYLLGDEPK